MTDQELELLCEQDEMYTQLWRDSLTQEQIDSI